jgi:hypothetical protein
MGQARTRGQAIMTYMGSIRAYAANDDPLAAACNFVALLVVSNQPFYPLYIYLSVSHDIGLSFFSFLSTPFFLAVPWLARRHSIAGRALLPLAGFANTALCTKLFGTASGVELFLLPCVMIAVLAFRPDERFAAFGLVAIAAPLFIFRDTYGLPVHLYTPEEYAHFVRLNAFSVGSLIVFAGLTFSNARCEPRRSENG